MSTKVLIRRLTTITKTQTNLTTLILWPKASPSAIRRRNHSTSNPSAPLIPATERSRRRKGHDQSRFTIPTASTAASTRAPTMNTLQPQPAQGPRAATLGPTSTYPMAASTMAVLCIFLVILIIVLNMTSLNPLRRHWSRSLGFRGRRTKCETPPQLAGDGDGNGNGDGGGENSVGKREPSAFASASGMVRESQSGADASLRRRGVSGLTFSAQPIASCTPSTTHPVQHDVEALTRLSTPLRAGFGPLPAAGIAVPAVGYAWEGAVGGLFGAMSRVGSRVGGRVVDFGIGEGSEEGVGCVLPGCE